MLSDLFNEPNKPLLTCCLIHPYLMFYPKKKYFSMPTFMLYKSNCIPNCNHLVCGARNSLMNKEMGAMITTITHFQKSVGDPNLLWPKTSHFLSDDISASSKMCNFYLPWVLIREMVMVIFYFMYSNTLCVISSRKDTKPMTLVRPLPSTSCSSIR